MLKNSKQILKDAKKNRKAVFQFNINNLEWTKCILEECNKERVPVILGVSESAIKYMGGYNVVASLVYSLITDLEIDIDVCLHLDHGSSLDSCIKAIDAGFNSVMIDGSKLPISENIELTRSVVEYAKNNDVSVEGEIGSIGNLYNGELTASKNTNIDDCVKFSLETGIDSIAPAVGTVHGCYEGELNIDYDLINKLSRELTIPLVLHGGSCLSNDILKKCLDSGITKININSDIQSAWSKDVKQYVSDNKEVIDPRKIIGSGFDSIKKVVSNKLEINKM